MTAAFEAGMGESEFWHSTPFMTRKRIEANAERERRSYRLALFGAWNAARYYRAKRMPNLKTEYQKLDLSAGRRSRQTPAQIWRTVEEMNRAFKGRDLRGGGLAETANG